jgi:Protein of unknown function (DUF3352)
MRVRLSLALLLASTGLVAAACGGGGGGGGGGTAGGQVPSGASVVPSTAPVLVSVDSDFSSDQWKQASALAKHFPGLPALIAMLQAQLQKQNVSFEQDVKPALGPETDVGFLDFKNGGNDVVVLTKPNDKAKLDALLAKGSSPPVTTEKDGWTVAADSKSKIDLFEQGAGTTLANDQEFQSVMKRLPADTLARAYVAGAPVQALLESSLSGTGVQTGLTSGFGTFKGLGLAATAKDNGVRLDGVIDGTLQAAPDSYKAELPSALPSGALLFVSFNQLDKQLRGVLKTVETTQPSLKTQISQVEAVLGLSLENDVFPLFSREGAIAVYPSTAGLPTIEAVFRVPDEAKAKSFVDRIGAIARLGGQTVKDVDVSGIAAHEVDITSQNLSLFYAVFDGKLVVTNTRDGIAGLRSSGPRLEADPLYREAADSAGLPGETVGFVYANLRAGLPLVFQLARSRGSTIPPAVGENTKPLGAALLYGTKEDQGYGLGGFVTVK